MAASTWFEDGFVSGYDAPSGTLNTTQYRLIASTPGVVDLNGVTRIESPLPSGRATRIIGRVPLRVEYDDYFFAQSRGNDITVQMFVAPQSGTATPSINDIIFGAASVGMIFRSTTWATDSPPPVGSGRNMYFYVNGPTAADLSGFNSAKFWVLLIPVEARKTDAPNSVRGYLSSYTTMQAKAVSLWKNRPPAAPVITSPVPGAVVTSGTSINLTLALNDPDKVAGGTSPRYTDLAGVQVQYAPRPTGANPNPAWVDLPFASSSGPLVAGPGWYLDRSSTNTAADGIATLWNTQTIQIRCGSNTLLAGRGILPAGSWQIRARVFDYGHPWPVAERPLGRLNGDYTPDTYPSSNTSPWSAATTITISTQVPPPIPTFPINSIALPVDGPITLSWQYRNTAVPPFAQQRRTVQIRKVGDTAWTFLANNALSGSPALTIAANTLDVSTEYEWRVQVTDTDTFVSNFSEIVRFWVIPAPASGVVRPLPGDTIDGATLGCGTHRVFVYRRGGKTLVGEIKNRTYTEWNRVRDDISTSKIVITDWDIDCGNLLSELQTWAYEIVIFRDNGSTSDRVWEGPITLLTYEKDTVTVHAKDVMAYAYRRILKQAMSDKGVGDFVTSRAARVLQNAFAPDDPNILPYLQVLSNSSDAVQYRSTPAFSRTAFEEVDDMASNAGLDYTAVGRAILLWGTKSAIGKLPEFKDADLGATPIVSEYGMSMANVYAVADGNGLYGIATRGGLTSSGGVVSGNDETYGLVEMLSSTWATDSGDSGNYTQEDAQKAVQSFEGYAEKSIASRYPPPVVVRIPDNTTLNPSAVISINQLVPGVLIPLNSTSTLRTVRKAQKLDSVKVVEENGAEKISITLSPFARNDADIAEGGEE